MKINPVFTPPPLSIPPGDSAHLLREVEAGSPAEQAGVEDGDLVLAVNGEALEAAGHELVVEKIRESGQRVSLTTITLKGRDYYRQVRDRRSDPPPVALRADSWSRVAVTRGPRRLFSDAVVDRLFWFCCVRF